MLYLTSGIDEICETNAVTSLDRISPVTSFPCKNTLSTSPSGMIFISMFLAISIRPSLSFTATFLLIESSTTHLYVIPVSIFINPNFFATFLVTVPLPLPAGPVDSYNYHICSFEGTWIPLAMIPMFSTFIAVKFSISFFVFFLKSFRESITLYP